MSLIAVNDNVILQKVNIEEKTKAGIILNTTKQSDLYKVISLGETVEKNLLTVGDIVYIRPTVGSSVNYSENGIDCNYRTVKYWEIEAIIEEATLL